MWLSLPCTRPVVLSGLVVPALLRKVSCVGMTGLTAMSVDSQQNDGSAVACEVCVRQTDFKVACCCAARSALIHAFAGA